MGASIRARREGREAQEVQAPRHEESSKPNVVPDTDDAAEISAAAYSSLPDKLRPHYQTLNAPPDATEADVRKLYRKLALKHHPDKNPDDAAGAKERFTKVAVAYEAVLEHISSLPPPKTGACIP